MIIKRFKIIDNEGLSFGCGLDNSTKKEIIDYFYDLGTNDEGFETKKENYNFDYIKDIWNIEIEEIKNDEFGEFGGIKVELSLRDIEQMFCKGEGILSKFTDTSILNISEWLSEKGLLESETEEIKVENRIKKTKQSIKADLNEILNKYSDNAEEEESVMRFMRDILKEGF